ncbi:putative vacuolar protein sorting-associated protein Ist1 [Helianthus debilis subsp. tardiflorus]
MLDGLLGRNGFSSKCKSLIKPTRTRIAALRRREEAKQRFLKEDLAKLLANGLDVNAYGRTEEFIAGLNLLACYTFLDQSCEYILKQLSVMQKLGQCPEECRETVSSLMFAAARFSDLPELRDLRNVFQERYGNGLECYVNQVFVEKLASKPPAVEKRIKLLQDIASELSIRWDSKGFKQRIEKPSTLAQALGSVSGSDGEHKPPNGNNMFRKNDQRSKERVEHAHQGPTLHGDGIVNVRRKDALDGPVLRREEKHHKERTKHHDVVDGPVLRREEKRQKERTEHHDDGNVYGRRKEVSDVSNVETNKKHGYKHENLIGNPESNLEKNIFGKNDRIPKVLDDDRVMRERKERNAYKHELETNETRDNNVLDGSVLRREEKRHKEKIYHHDDSRREEKHRKERIYHHDDGNAYGRKKELSDIPYVETNKKHAYKHEPETIEKNIYGHNDRGSKERNGYKHKPETRSPIRVKEDGEKSTGKVKDEDAIRSKSTYNSSLPPPYVKLNIPPPYSKPHNASNSEKMKEEAEHDIMQLPKPKSVRRKHRHKHSKSSSGHEDIGSSEDARIVKRISSSKRKDRKGLQILFDDEQCRSHRDDEEKMMDKLLLHYSKKPSSGYDIEKLRRKKNRSNMNSKSPSPHHNDAEMSVPPARSISLPHESGEVEPKKVYARANSFQPDNQAKHVHPKLPDYDDLAARFAALRGR